MSQKGGQGQKQNKKNEWRSIAKLCQYQFTGGVSFNYYFFMKNYPTYMFHKSINAKLHPNEVATQKSHHWLSFCSYYSRHNQEFGFNQISAKAAKYRAVVLKVWFRYLRVSQAHFSGVLQGQSRFIIILRHYFHFLLD